MNNIDNYLETEKYQPIVFVNNPIANAEEDIIGFDTQVETLQCAINNGANMIGIIADYGSGKSSMAEMLSISQQKVGNPAPIKINMWDCLSDINETDKISENVSTLTKSFLYQLSNGENSKFGRYINRILSKNYSSIALSINDGKRFWISLAVAGVSYTLYQILCISNTGIMKHLPNCFDVIASGLKLSAPIFVLLAIVAVIIGIKDAYIAFSHWNTPHRREPEINDVFDTYNIIVKKIKPKDDKKRLIFIDDLDRIDKKKLIVEFLKELYRFQDSLGEDKKKFVFIISIKPESNLKESKKDDETDNDEIDEVYSKIFDLTLSLKPIHFDDYDSILLKLLKNNPEQKSNLEKLIGQDIQDVLPESFRWIKRGTNLTLRDLKDRLNQAISIMISLKNKDYQVKTAVNFEACAAVAYLENKYPKDYYNLIKSETELGNFLQNSRPIIDKYTKDKIIDEVRKVFIDVFDEKKATETFNETFVTELCEMVLDRLFNDDFRMYFYTYPKGSHIKTTDERALCNYILFPNSYSNYEKLDGIVERAFETGENLIVKQTINSLESFPPVLLENNTLFLLAIKISIRKTFDLFWKKVIMSNIEEEHKANYWKRTLVLSDEEHDKFVSMITKKFIGPLAEPDVIIANRKAIIKGVEGRIMDYKDLYISPSFKMPQITNEEIELIDDVDTSIQLVDINTLKEDHYEYLIPIINSKELITGKGFNYALEIWLKFSSFFKPEVIGEDLLTFLSINQFVHDEFFSIICDADIENEKIASYLNKILDKSFSKEFLKMINDLGFKKDISEDIIVKLLDNNLYFTPLLYCVSNNCLSKINEYISDITGFLKTCERINGIDSKTIVEIRMFLYKEKCIEQYKVLYYEPYPIITENEYASMSEIDLIDVSQINEENYQDIVNIIHSKEYSHEELIFLMRWIFDKDINENCLTKSSVRKKVFDSINFKGLNIKKYNEQERDGFYNMLEDDFAISNGDEAIAVLNNIGCLIPKVEAFIQKYDSYKEDYCNTIAQLDEMTTQTLKWCDENYITCSLSPSLCKLLYDNGDYQNYIIAETLRQKYLSINYDIDFSNYIEVYKNVEKVFDIMSENWDFLEKIQEECNFEELDEEKLAPVFVVRQTERFFNYIFSEKTSEALKKRYLNEFGSFKEEKDSKAFQKLICQEENMNLLGSVDLYDRIYHLLWASHPAHKGVFTRVWNSHWKEKLNLD